MKLKAAITDGAPQELFEVLGSPRFAATFMDNVVAEIFDAEEPWRRPAEYYLQLPDRTASNEFELWGVEVRLTGVSRNGREPKVFHQALRRLEELVKDAVESALTTQQKAQVFVVIMLDGEIELVAGSGHYGSVLESEAEWVTGRIDPPLSM